MAEEASYRQGLLMAMAVLTGQWVPAVLASLAAGPMNVKDLLDDINRAEEQSGWQSHNRPLTRKVLNETLQRLQRHQIVARTDTAEELFQPVFYSLTSTGRSLLSSLRPLVKWARNHQDELAVAKDR